MHKVFAIVVTYNGDKWINKCIDSLKKSLTPVEIIVVDNGSTDETKKILNQYKDIFLILSEINLGFGRANNKGIEIALESNADYIFLLNQDAWVEKETISSLVEVAKNNPDYGIISPVHLNGTYSGLDIKFSEQVAPRHCNSFYSDMYINKFKDLYQVEFVNAAAWFLSRKCIEKTGLFDPIFFLYGEDNNLLQRANFHGFKSGVTPLCTICHDREIRKGNFNETGIKNWERTSTLITLLNILENYSNCINIFLKMRINALLKSIYLIKFSLIKIHFKEIVFFILNFFRIRKIRSKYKIPNNNLAAEV